MVNNLVLEALLLESHVGHERIRVNRAASLDVSANIGLQKMFLAITDDSGANLTTAFKNALNGSLVFGTGPINPSFANVFVHISGKPTDQSFVNFYSHSFATQLHERAGLQSQTEPL